MSPAHPPDSIIRDLYLEITNISQGVNIAIFVYILTTREFNASILTSGLSTVLIAAASLLSVVIFWARYYLDTAILDRSFSALSVTWFFIYIVAEGISISLIPYPAMWFLATSVFLFCGAGFYLFNLREAARKQQAGVLELRPEFIGWQRRRLVELLVLAATSLGGSLLVSRFPVTAIPAALLTLAFSLWQVYLTNDYRRYQFIATGL
ncbi:MAG TPA: hypothetical protein PLQ56_05780 [Aggregatilineales bacterium]|nr:hypothetical protein [Aggregatilineales bacterium]